MAQLLGICQAEVSRLETTQWPSGFDIEQLRYGSGNWPVAEFPQARSVTIVLVDTPDDLPPKRS